MRNISKEDFILWDIVKQAPSQHYDLVYHYTTLVEFVNGGLTIPQGQEFKCVAELSKSWQKIISDAIEQAK